MIPFLLVISLRAARPLPSACVERPCTGGVLSCQVLPTGFRILGRPFPLGLTPSGGLKHVLAAHAPVHVSGRVTLDSSEVEDVRPVGKAEGIRWIGSKRLEFILIHDPPWQTLLTVGLILLTCYMRISHTEASHHYVSYHIVTRIVGRELPSAMCC